MSSHGHRHFRSEFDHNRMVGQKYFYLGTGANKSIKFDIKVDWLIIINKNGTKYGVWDYDNNQCLLSGNFNSNPSVDNSIQSSDNINFIFNSALWSVLNDPYCIIAFGCSPRENLEGVFTPAFHKHTHGYDEKYKTQMRVHKWTGSGAGVGFATFRFNYGFAYIYDWTANRMFIQLSPYAYISYGSRNAHMMGFNATNPSYELNVLNTNGDSEALKETGKPGGVLDIVGHQYYAWAVGVYHDSAYINKGGAYPGHKHIGGWDDYNRVIGYVDSYVGNASGGTYETCEFALPDIVILFRQGADNNDIVYIKVRGFSGHAGNWASRLTKLATSVATVDNILLYYEGKYEKLMFFRDTVDENAINYHYLVLKIINPKTVV